MDNRLHSRQEAKKKADDSGRYKKNQEYKFYYILCLLLTHLWPCIVQWMYVGPLPCGTNQTMVFRLIYLATALGFSHRRVCLPIHQQHSTRSIFVMDEYDIKNSSKYFDNLTFIASLSFQSFFLSIQVELGLIHMHWQKCLNCLLKKWMSCVQSVSSIWSMIPWIICLNQFLQNILWAKSCSYKTVDAWKWNCEP